LILGDNPEATEELLAFSINTMKAQNIVGQGNNIGQIDPKRWQTFYNEMSNYGIFPKGLKVENAYTLDFLPTIKAK
jgi:hypothetical protein